MYYNYIHVLLVCMLTEIYANVVFTCKQKNRHDFRWKCIPFQGQMLKNNYCFHLKNLQYTLVSRNNETNCWSLLRRINMFNIVPHLVFRIAQKS